MRRAGRWATSAGLVGAIAVSAMGLLHLPVARPLLAKLGMKCPAASVTASQVEAARRPALERMRGERPAPARPALGLVLDRTTEAQAQAWASKLGLSCRPKARGLHFIECRAVPAAAVGEEASLGPAELTLSFGSRGTLISVDSFRGGLEAPRAESVLAQVKAALDAQVGPPDRALGEPTSVFLSGGMLSTAVYQYRFSDYAASITATNVGGGIAVREQYLSASRDL